MIFARASGMRRVILAATLLAAIGCATNPVTGKREFNIVSEAQEIAIGQEQHPQVIEEFGIYDEKPELNQMVNRIGQRIAAVSDRPNLQWHFTLLDSPVVNAMALPGGYVYVTRGIVERMNSEDELAGVIAHEISHVAARHAARSMSQQQLAQIGLVLGSMVAGPAATEAFGGLVQLGAGLLFTRYSRQQETQADLLGTAYMTEAGYNPRGAENMLLALQRLDKGQSSGIERYFIDHPDPRKRVGDVRKEIATLESKNPSIGTTRIDRSPFVRQLDRVITAASTMQTTIRNNTVFNRRYGIIITAPSGWKATTEPGALFVLAPQKATGEGFIAQEIALRQMQQYPSLQVAIRSQLQSMGLQYVRSGTVSSATGQTFPVDLWRGATQNGTVAVESTQFAEGENAVVFLSLTPEQRGSSARDLASIVQRMRFDRAEARAAEPPRIRVATSRAGETWDELAERATGRREDASAIAKLNGFDYPSSVPPGIAIKLPQDVAPDER
jgi:predicted Zn-dependent protease